MEDINSLELTDKQKKAFNSLKRAFKKCKKEGIRFYVVLDTIYVMNGENVSQIHDDPPRNHRGKNICLGELTVSMPYICDSELAGWADDTSCHYVELKGK